jgi:serine/threonine protein kinase
MSETNAAENLQGLTMDTGWEVLEKIQKPPGSTGAFFSICYKVKKDGQICFLKAFNFARFLQLSHGPGKQVVDVMSEMIDAYKFERDLSLLCEKKHVTKVVIVKDYGEQIVQGFSITVVPYLIFDLADQDVRTKLTFTEKLDIAWKLKSLHSVAVGLKQLHTIDVSHQDLKPSNVLVFKDESKIGDLGRSTCPTLAAPHMNEPFAGQINYAPPEILYGSYEKDWRKRSFASDCYLFGSLIVFYFAGTTMNALIRKHISDALSWEHYHGSFEDVRAYLLASFSKALDEFDSCLLVDGSIKTELRTMVEYLCYPLPEKRGHPKGISTFGDQYDMERVIQRLDFLYRKAKYELSI